MAATETVQPHPLEDFYTNAELCLHLSRVRGSEVPARTLRYWKRKLGMYPNDFGMYDTQDAVILAGLIGFIQRGRTIAQYRNYLINQRKEQANAN